MVTRRQFLSVLAAASAAIVVPELVVPRRSFFLPPPGGWPRGAIYIGTRFHDDDLAGTLLQPLPFREPDPALFDLINLMNAMLDHQIMRNDPTIRFGGRYA